MLRSQVGLILVLLGLMTAGPCRGVVITFDDLTTRNNFFDLGIAGSYMGFQWGLPGQTPQTSLTGWASGTVANPAASPAPTPISGNSYAWNWDGPQSLLIAFGSAYNVTGGYFATLSSAYGSNASTIQLFGYDSGGALVATSGVLNLSNSFQYLTAGFTGVYSLEIRADGNEKWFSMDDITVSAVDSHHIPETSTIWLGGAGLVALGLLRRKSK